MKAQMKAILASLVIIAVALSAVSGITYSWWSDSESTNITIDAGSLDVDVSNISCKVGPGASGSFIIGESPSQTNNNGSEVSSLSLITNINNAAPYDQYIIEYDVSFSTTIYSKYMVQVETDVDWIKVEIETINDGNLILDEWTDLPDASTALNGTHVAKATIRATITILDNAPQKPISSNSNLGDAHISIINIITQKIATTIVNGAEDKVNMVGQAIFADNGPAFENEGEAVLKSVVMEGGTKDDYGVILKGESSRTEFTDVTINSSGGGVGIVYGAKATFNSGSVYVDTASTSGRYLFYLEGPGSELTINGGKFSWDPNDNQKRAYVYADSGTIVNITGGEFEEASTRGGYTDGLLGEGTITITGGKFGFDPSKWVPEEGYDVVEVNGTWTVSQKT